MGLLRLFKAPLLIQIHRAFFLTPIIFLVWVIGFPLVLLKGYHDLNLILLTSPSFVLAVGCLGLTWVQTRYARFAVMFVEVFIAIFFVGLVCADPLIHKQPWVWDPFLFTYVAISLVLAISLTTRRGAECFEETTNGGHRTLAQGLLIGVTLTLVVGVMRQVAWPPIPRYRPPSRCTCGNNLKQIGLAMAMYADNYGDRCPMDAEHPTLVGSMQLLSNFLSSAKVLHCSDDKRPGAKAETDFRKLTTKNISYCYVPNLIWQSNADSIVMLDRIDSTTKGSRWPAWSDHNGRGGYVLFLDGHTAFCTNLPVDLRDRDGKLVVLSP